MKINHVNFVAGKTLKTIPPQTFIVIFEDHRRFDALDVVDIWVHDGLCPVNLGLHLMDRIMATNGPKPPDVLDF